MKTAKGRISTVVLIIAVAAMCLVGTLMAQTGQSPPARAEPQYFVTGEGDEAHLWVREGTKLRCLGHGECKAHQHGDGHDHKDHDKP